MRAFLPRTRRPGTRLQGVIGPAHTRPGGTRHTVAMASPSHAGFRFDNSYARLPARFFARVEPPFERGHGDPQHVAAHGSVEQDIVLGGFDPVDVHDVDE